MAYRAPPESNAGGFLAEIFAENDKIRVRQPEGLRSRLSSTDFQAGLVWAEVAATRSAIPGIDIASVPSTQLFKDALQESTSVVKMSAAHGSAQVILVKWRSESAAADGVARTTLYNIGFKPAELRDEYIKQAVKQAATVVGGYRVQVLGHCVSVAILDAARGFRFYVPIPPGWTDEQLMTALVMQGGLDFNHVRTFGVDLKHSSVISEPSGDVDLFFNFAPAGYIGHGSDSLVPLTQPPGRVFVTHPITGVENHLKMRKARACGDCWKPGPTRHS